MKSTEIGNKIGQAIARDVLAEDMPKKWTGLDPQDADVAIAEGFEPDTDEWMEMEAAAKAAYLLEIDGGR
jgi:hypothetical protein